MEPSGKATSGETVDTPQHRTLGPASRVSILRLLRDTGAGMTAADVAARTGQHLSTTRAHLERLAGAGLLVKARANGGQPGRPAWRYRATATDPAPAAYRVLVAALLEHLPSDADGRTAGRVGRDWGLRLAASVPPQDDPVEAVTAVLGGLGLSPHRQPSGPGAASVEVHLRTCPFLELVGQRPDAVCGLHAGLVRGVLESRGVRDAEAVLEPFGAPHACVVRLPPPRHRAGRR
ncbi:helix-turn-helix domain-containing protein [Dactylosporangium salmoneum]|uniref:Helix-turn-helix domain-containing protein n=1 Tax=Dactylosporangium salmoneum TaxID=53361 RepID=A0ABP5TRE4_9ACTN